MLLAMFFTFHIALHQLFVPLFTLSIFHTQWYKPNSLLYIPANKFGLSQLMYIHHNPKSYYSLLSTWCWPILKLKLFAVPRLMMLLPWTTLLLWFLMFEFVSCFIFWEFLKDAWDARLRFFYLLLYVCFLPAFHKTLSKSCCSCQMRWFSR